MRFLEPPPPPINFVQASHILHMDKVGHVAAAPGKLVQVAVLDPESVLT